MSMFHELMMRKKEQIMYATIKGSPTESPSGVFSGFSASNYLALQEPFAPTGSWEIVTKITTGDSLINNVRYFLGNFDSERSLVVGTTDNPIQTFKAFISTNGGVSFNIQLVSNVEAQTNTEYYIRVGFTGNKYYLDFSTDGINYVGRAEYSSTSKISPYILYYGRVFGTGNLWNGSIDLNNSYIKIGSTKYNLQAVVGYTVVGSPTITDGVLSNTSSSNFIRTPNFPEYSSLEAEVVTTISSATSSFQSIFALTGNYAIVFEYRNAIAIRYRIYNDSATEVYDGTYSIVANQPITINLKINGNNAVITIIQNDTIKFQKSYSITRITNSSRFQLGYFWQGLTTGSVDLNKTFVKLDNKLWFNGQEE